MKRLILLLLFIPLISFGQDITNLSLERTPIYQKKTEGVFYFKEGVFYAVSVANSGFTSIKKMTRQAEEQMENFAKNNKYKYELIKVDEEKGGLGKYTTSINWYKVYELDGSLVSNKVNEEAVKEPSKNNAIEELKKLKELLDLDLITKEEFDKKSKELKKIILGS
tara:strand:+ start:132 stop:629 length:498 start_codon:yes stop_codon:yes gene_type:complete